MDAWKKAQHTDLTATFLELIETRNTAALLLSPVGEPLPRPTTRQEVRNLFGLLWELHAKDLSMEIHIVSNVILTEEAALD